MKWNIKINLKFNNIHKYKKYIDAILRKHKRR